jgi:hypothetical protein
MGVTHEALDEALEANVEFGRIIEVGVNTVEVHAGSPHCFRRAY